MRYYPERLSVEITSRCNLSCEICPRHSLNYHQIDSDMDFQTFEMLKPLFPYINSLVLSGIGEPLLHPNIEKFIAFANSHMPTNSLIGFQTNGVLLSIEKLNELIKAGLNRICLSIDTLIHHNGFHDPEFAKKALEVILHSKSNGAKGLKSGIEIVITMDNIDQIIPIVKESIKYKIDFVIISHLIPYSQITAPKISYETNNEETIKIFKKWLRKLEKSGYTIDDWLALTKKKALPGSFDDRYKPLKFFKAMYNEAASKGLTLNMKNLINRNDELTKRVKAIFRELESISKKTNIPIHIPRLNPTPQRKCDFIEEKCMYIGVTGEVSPCYFLWHSFSCYIGGLKKSVKKWTFGNIHESDPIEIFNAPSYRQFVESVLRYDFPYCYDCNFALCDLMELEDFIYDCFTNDIPCGACLWCGGLFNCMR